MSNIIEKINEFGYFRTTVSGKDEFSELCSGLGTVKKYTDVVIDNNKSWYLNKHSAFPLHTDAPDIDVIAWHCLIQDSVSGETILIDARKTINELPSYLLDRLENIKIRVQTSEQFTPLLISRKPERLYFAPWNIKEECLPNPERLALIEFKKMIDSTPPISIRLKSNEVLLLNNSFMLHGRDAIPEDSTRHLVRAYIKL